MKTAATKAWTKLGKLEPDFQWRGIAAEEYLRTPKAEEPTAWRAAPSLRSGRLIHSMLRRPSEAGAFHPLYIRVAAGGIWALAEDCWFNSRLVYKRSREEVTKSNYIWARSDFGEGHGQAVI